MSQPITMREVNGMSGNDLGRYLRSRDTDPWDGMGAVASDGKKTTTTATVGTPTSTSTSAPNALASRVIPVNNALAAALAPFGSIIDLIPNPPNYKDFTKDFKVRPVDALVNLFTPLDWLIYDTINEANAASSVKAGSARRIGLPGRQVDFVMGTGLPPGLDPTTAAYTKRLIALQNFLILAYQDPTALAKGLVRALSKAVSAGVISATQMAQVAGEMLQAATAQGVALFSGLAEGVEAPDKRFVTALINQFKIQMPQLQFLVDAQRAFNDAKAAAAAAAAAATAEAQRVAQLAAQKAQQAATEISIVTPVLTKYTTFVSGVGGGPLHLNEAMAAYIDVNNDSGVKNAADQVKAAADNARKALVTTSAKALMTMVYDNAEHVKQVASDLQGKKDNWGNRGGRLPYLVAQAATLWRAPVIPLPATFAGYSGFRGFGITGAEDAAIAAAVATYSGPTAGTAVVSGGTAGVATAPATTPGIAGLIQSILGQFGGMSIPGITGGGGTATGPAISIQPKSATAAPGAPVTFTVIATAPAGSPLAAAATLTYQWLKNSTPIPGATSSTLTVNAQPSYDGSPDQYTVKVCAGTACTTSAVANLTVRAAGAQPGPTGQKTTFEKALPYVLGAGALVSLPVAGPLVALAIGAGAAAAALKKPAAPATPAVTPAGTNVVDVRGLGNANLKALLSGLGDVPDPSDPLAPIAAGVLTIKAKSNASSSVIKAARALLAANGVNVSTGSQWTQGDEDLVRDYQRSHGIRVTAEFDAATLAALRGPTAPGMRPVINVPKPVASKVPLVAAGVAATAAVLYAVLG